MAIPWWAWVLLALWMVPAVRAAVKALQTPPQLIGGLPEEGEPPPRKRPWWERLLFAFFVPILLTFDLIVLLGFAFVYPVVRVLRLGRWRPPG